MCVLNLKYVDEALQRWKSAEQERDASHSLCSCRAETIVTIRPQKQPVRRQTAFRAGPPPPENEKLKPQRHVFGILEVN